MYLWWHAGRASFRDVIVLNFVHIVLHFVQTARCHIQYFMHFVAPRLTESSCLACDIHDCRYYCRLQILLQTADISARCRYNDQCRRQKSLQTADIIANCRYYCRLLLQTAVIMTARVPCPTNFMAKDARTQTHASNSVSTRTHVCTHMSLRQSLLLP